MNKAKYADTISKLAQGHLNRLMGGGSHAETEVGAGRYVSDRMRTGELRAGDPDAFAAAYMTLLDRMPVLVMTGLAAPDEDALAAEAASVSRMMMTIYAPAGAAVTASRINASPQHQDRQCR